MALQPGCTEIYQPLLLMLLHPKSRCTPASCAGGLGCCHGSPSAVEKSGLFQRQKLENRDRSQKIKTEAVAKPAAKASVIFAKGFWRDLLGAFGGQ